METSARPAYRHVRGQRHIERRLLAIATGAWIPAGVHCLSERYDGLPIKEAIAREPGRLAKTHPVKDYNYLKGPDRFFRCQQTKRIVHKRERRQIEIVIVDQLDAHTYLQDLDQAEEREYAAEMEEYAYESLRSWFEYDDWFDDDLETDGGYLHDQMRVCECGTEYILGDAFCIECFEVFTESSCQIVIKEVIPV